jgi:NTP pyrophosphatase (non-canonical NTP hydrolase)
MVSLLADDIIQKCIEKWGFMEQLHQAMGECGEFVAVAQNYYRAMKFGNKKTTIEDFMEEVVDVVFLMQQMRYADPELFDNLIEKKKQKLLRKLENK